MVMLAQDAPGETVDASLMSNPGVEIGVEIGGSPLKHIFCARRAIRLYARQWASAWGGL